VKSTHFSTIFVGSWSGQVSTNSGFASNPFREESSPSVRGAFALTVPAGDGNGTSWDYDVHVSLFDLDPGTEPWVLWPWVWATGPATAPLPERNSDPLTPYVVIVTTPHINDDRAPTTAVFAKPATLTLLMGQHGHFGDTLPPGLLNGERTRPVMYETPGGATVPAGDAGGSDSGAWWACDRPGSCGGALVDAAAPPASGKIVSTQLAWLAPVTLLVGVHPCPSFVGGGGYGLNCGPPPCATPAWTLTGGATGACHGDFYDYSLAAAGIAQFQATCVRHPEGGTDSITAGSVSGTCTVAGPCGCFPPAVTCNFPDASAVCGIE
jgi:hypothetical protein